jgi:ribosome-binding protein aMBF1 (putative translation factor)
MVTRRTAITDPRLRASRKLPAEQRPAKYSPSGLAEAREAAGVSIEELAQRTGYDASVIRSMEAGEPFHTVSISRVSAALGDHDLRQVRGEGEGSIQVTRVSHGHVIVPGESED